MRSKPSEKPRPNYKKGLWSPDEDQKLTHYLMNHGHACWSSVAINSGLQRNGKSCRLRWINYLRPGLKREGFSTQEQETILTLHELLGNRWSQISQHLPGRTDNEIKNYWHSHLKKRLAKSEEDLQPHHNTNSNMATRVPSSTCLNTSNFTSTSFADTDESVPSISHISNPPKLLFAEWTSLNEFPRDFSNSSDLPVSHGSGYEVTTPMHGSLSNERSTHHRKDSQNCITNGLKEDISHTELTLDQIFSFNDGDFDIGDFMCM